MSDNMHRGPWTLRAHDNYMREGGDAEPLEIVDCDGEVVACNTSYYPTELSAKYAHMQAAAPELYEALEAAANSSGFQYMFSETRDKINAALAKARGEKL